MSALSHTIVSVLPTCIPTLQKPYPCLSTLDLLSHPILANQSSIPHLNGKHGSENEGGIVEIKQSVTPGSTEIAGVVADGYIGGGYRDCYGGFDRGWRCALSGNAGENGNVSLSVERLNKEERKGERRERTTKTTSAPVAKETDERIVNVGLVIALLGLLSVVC